MKKLITVFCLLLIVPMANGQEVLISDVNLRAFSGVEPMGNGGYYFFHHVGKNEAKGESDFKLRFMDSELNETNSKDISLSKYSDLAASAATESHLLFIFYDYNKRTITYIVYDDKGNEVSRREIPKMKRKLMTADNFPYAYTVGDNFVVVKAVKEPKVGYDIEVLDKELNSVAKKTFAPEKKEMSIVDVKYKDEKIYVLRETGPINGKVFNMEIVCHEAASGNEKFVYNLFDGIHSGYPTFLQVADDNQVYSGGMYFKGNKTSNTDSEGFFFINLDTEGQKVAYAKHTWDEVKAYTKEKGTSSMWGGKTKLLVQDVILNEDKSFSIVAEAYRKSKPGKAGEGKSLGKSLTPNLTLGGMTGTSAEAQADWAYTIMDFNIFEFDSNGKFSGVRKIFKPDQVIYVKQGGRKVRGLKTAMELKRNGYFGYMYNVNADSKSYLVSKMIMDKGKLVKIPEKFIYFFPLQSFGMEDAGKIKVRAATVSAKKKGFGNALASMATTLGMYDERLYDISGENDDLFTIDYGKTNGAVYERGNLIFYNFNIMDKTMRVWKEGIPEAGN